MFLFIYLIQGNDFRINTSMLLYFFNILFIKNEEPNIFIQDDICENHPLAQHLCF